MGPDKTSLDQLRIHRDNAPEAKSRVGLILTILVLLVVIGIAAWWFNRPKVAEVRTIVIRQSAGGGEKTLLNASGYVTARREATVSSKVTGKVMEVLVEEGMTVEAGQILARLDASNVEQNLQLAQARLESAQKAIDETRANLAQSEREWQRMIKLMEDKITSASELDRAEVAVTSLKARVERQLADVRVAERELALWNQQLDDTIIRAPFTGIVTSKNAQPGEMISPMSAGGFTRTGICTIVDMKSLEIEVDVSESYINRVEASQPVEATLDSYPEWRIPAKVIAIIPTADRQKATVRVRVGFDKLDTRILPDMGVKVAFQRTAGATPAAAESIVVSQTAVRKDNGQDIVFVVREGRVERRAVTVGTARGNEVSITAGLASGDKIVISGPDNLSDGAKVTEAK